MLIANYQLYIFSFSATAFLTLQSSSSEKSFNTEIGALGLNAIPVFIHLLLFRKNLMSILNGVFLCPHTNDLIHSFSSSDNSSNTLGDDI